MPELKIEKTEFVYSAQDGRRTSQDLVGAELELGGAGPGLVRRLRIDRVRADPNADGILLHTFAMQDAQGHWYNPCNADAFGLREGFPLAGRWNDAGRFEPDEHYVAFTCTSGAEGKCIRAGYRPWGEAADHTSLLPMFEACVRLMRADYCGTGQPATLPGTRIELYDRLGLNTPDHDPGFLFEAGWTSEGAVCVHHTRVGDQLSLDALKQRCPDLDIVGGACTEEEAISLGAVLFNLSQEH